MKGTITKIIIDKPELSELGGFGDGEEGQDSNEENLKYDYHNIHFGGFPQCLCLLWVRIY